MSNFDFLKRVNENLYIIAVEAEKLFRDEYFEQCVTQTRRLAENLCRDVMLGKCQSSDSFDEMLATLKDTPAQNDFEKEFLDDLYFLKKAGNTATHSLTVKQDGNIALECLQRAFEASLNYAVFKKGLESKYLQIQFDEKLLATGKKSKKSKITEKFEEEEKAQKKSKKSKLEHAKKATIKNKTSKQKNKTSKKDKDDFCENTNKKRYHDPDKKPWWKELLETILAGLVITIVYFLIFNK